MLIYSLNNGQTHNPLTRLLVAFNLKKAAEDLLSPEYGCGSCSCSLLLSQFFHGFQCRQSQEEVQGVLPQSLYMLWNLKTRMPSSSIVSKEGIRTQWK
ncbi:unnamed protein product, partial [Vitis vinifera]